MKPYVIKIGGSTLGRHDTTLEDLVTLQKRGVPLVVVHGGGSRVTEWLKRQGTETGFIDGVRVTDEKSLEMVAAVLGGLVNTDLVAYINKIGGLAVGMTGVDGRILECKVTDPAIGYAGKVVKVNTIGIKALLKAGLILMLAPPGAKSPDEPLDIPYVNINGDDIAGKIARAMEAEKLVFLTDVAGIRDSEGDFIAHLSPDDARELIENRVISKGMIPKTEAALIAIETGCEVMIADGRVPHALIDAIDGEPTGTVIR